MKVNTSSDKYDVMAEINMVPFIDVALVLLIIFMVMTPFLVKEQIKINLPKTKSTNTPVDNTKRPIQVNITSAGAIYVNGAAIREDQVFTAIKQQLEEPATQPVVIAADKDVAFEKVVVAMDAAKRCGAKQLGISAMHNESGAANDAPLSPSAQKSSGKTTGAKHGGGAAKPSAPATSKSPGQPHAKR